MGDICGILFPRREIGVDGTAECPLPAGHIGPHIAGNTAWKTDWECDCEDCQRADPCNWCVIYWPVFTGRNALKEAE